MCVTLKVSCIGAIAMACVLQLFGSIKTIAKLCNDSINAIYKDSELLPLNSIEILQRYGSYFPSIAL